MLIALLLACRVSCVAFTWQPADAHSCCPKPASEDDKENCKSELFESAYTAPDIALVPADAAPEAPAPAFHTVLHSPPDLLTLHHVLLV